MKRCRISSAFTTSDAPPGRSALPVVSDGATCPALANSDGISAPGHPRPGAFSRPGVIPHMLACCSPGCRMISPAPELNASGAHVIGSMASPRRRRDSSPRVSPLYSIAY